MTNQEWADFIEARLSFIDPLDRPIAREIIKAYRDDNPRAWGAQHVHLKNTVTRIVECLKDSVTGPSSPTAA